MWTSNIRHPFVFVSLMLFSSFSSSERRVSFVFFVFLDDDELDCIGGLIIPFEANSFFFFLPPSVKVASRLLLEPRDEKEREQERRVGRGHHRYHESFVVVVVIPFVFCASF
jgi:hypothetical protein